MSLRKTEAMNNNNNNNNNNSNSNNNNNDHTNNKASFKNLINLETELVPQRSSRSKSRSRVNKDKVSSFAKTNRSRGLTQNHSQKQIGSTQSRRQTVGPETRQRQKIFNKVCESKQNLQEQQQKRQRQKQNQLMKQIITMKNTLTSIQKDFTKFSNEQNQNKKQHDRNIYISQIDLEQNAKSKILQINNYVDQFHIDFKTKTKQLSEKYINDNVFKVQNEDTQLQIPNQLKFNQIISFKADEVVKQLNMEDLQIKLQQAENLLNKKKII